MLMHHDPLLPGAFSEELWQQVSKRLLAKVIEEFAYERVFGVVEEKPGTTASISTSFSIASKPSAMSLTTSRSILRACSSDTAIAMPRFTIRWPFAQRCCPSLASSR